MSSPRPHLLSHLVAQAAERAPHEPALVGADEGLDHEELATRVAKLATALRAEGVHPGDRVAVFAPKSVGSFVAMHAALHAGAIAVPVNPMAPAAMVAELVAELRPAAVVLSPPTAERWPAAADRVVSVGHPAGDRAPLIEWDDLEGVDATGPVDRLGSDPAYLITTSGSTGRPKSIVHTHASGLRYAELAADCYGLRADDRMANVAPFHFDQSTFELYAGPLVGASVVLLPEVLLRFPASVGQLIERERVTTWYSVPTILRQLLERGGIEERDLSSLRWVLFGGEVFPPSQLRRLMELVPAARFSNVYGPAEVNQCTFHHLEGPPDDGAAVPIGAAWPDTELRVVDDRGESLQGPARGELHVRTATAMAGYWDRPELTAAAFVEETADGSLRRRWYRTGDLVERDEAGDLLFLGRLDRQVKIRGVRVELEAVEAALGAVQGVTGSAVLATDDPEVALVGVVESTTISDQAEIRRSLLGTLTPEATPDRIVIVEQLPRTTSGKVDVGRAAESIDTGAPV